MSIEIAKHFAICAFFLLSVSPSCCMQIYKTKDNRPVTVNLIWLTNNSQELDGTLSQEVWKVIIDLHSLNTFLTQNPQISIDLTSTNANPFIVHQASISDATKLLEILDRLILKNSVVDALLEAYVIFMNGKIRFSADQKIPDDFKRIIDKYCYLYYQKHVTSRELSGPIGIAELLKKSAPFKESLEKGYLAKSFCLVATSYPEAQSLCTAHSLVLILSCWSLTSLSGIDALLEALKLQKSSIVLLDVRNNRLTDISPENLQGFTNLKALYMSANSSQILLSNDAKKNCSQLSFIDSEEQVPNAQRYPLARVPERKWHTDLTRKISSAITDSDIVFFVAAASALYWIIFIKK